MTNIMILGGAGFIGSHVADLLHKDKHNRLFIFDDLSTGKWENIKQHFIADHNTRVKFAPLDVKDGRQVRDAFESFKPEIVVLLAAQAAISKSEDDPKFDADTNIGGMLNVISAAKQSGARRIVFSSTSAVYREKRWGKLKETDLCGPCSPYGISKFTAEQYLRSQFKESVVLRFGNVYGPRQVPIGENQVIPRMIRHFKYGDDFQIFGIGRQTRDYVYVEDVAEAVKCAITGKPGTYNIATGKRLSVNEIARGIEKLFDVPGYPWEHRAEADTRGDICLDVRAADEFLGWKRRVSLAEGLKRTKEWWDLPEDKPQAVKMPLVCEVVR